MPDFSVMCAERGWNVMLDEGEGERAPLRGVGEGSEGVAESQNVTGLTDISMWKSGKSVKDDFNISCV